MNKKRCKVLFVATSRKTMGGITSVLKKYEKMEIWNKYNCAWLETQINKGIISKLYYIIRAYITMLFIVPQYNIIHFHTVPGRSIIVQMPIFLYSLLCRKKIIIHIHVGNQLLEYKKDKIFNFTIRKANKVIVLASSLQELMKEHYGIETDVLYNPIEEKPIRNNSNIDKSIFFAAYMTKNKGYHTLLNAFKEVSIKHPGWKLLLAGSGEIDNVKKIRKELDIENNVEIHQWLNSEQMNEKYQRASIYCIASKQEGFPMSFLEAASYGIPIVTTPVGGIIDVIVNEENCMIFRFENVKELTNQINKLIENKELYFKISNNLRKLVKEKFSISTINKNIELLYNSL